MFLRRCKKKILLSFILSLLLPKGDFFAKIKSPISNKKSIIKIEIPFQNELQAKGLSKEKAYYSFDKESCAYHFKHRERLVEEFEEVSALIWILVSYDKETFRDFRKLIDDKTLEIQMKNKRVDNKLLSFKKRGVPDAMGEFYLSLMIEKFHLAYEHTEFFKNEFSKIYSNWDKNKKEFLNVKIDAEVSNHMTHFLLSESLIHQKIKERALVAIAALKDKNDKMSGVIKTLDQKLPRVINILSLSGEVLHGFENCAKRDLNQRKKLGKDQGMSFKEQDIPLMNHQLY